MPPNTAVAGMRFAWRWALNLARASSRGFTTGTFTTWTGGGLTASGGGATTGRRPRPLTRSTTARPPTAPPPLTGNRTSCPFPKLSVVVSSVKSTPASCFQILSSPVCLAWHVGHSSVSFLKRHSCATHTHAGCAWCSQKGSFCVVFWSQYWQSILLGRGHPISLTDKNPF